MSLQDVHDDHTAMLGLISGYAFDLRYILTATAQSDYNSCHCYMC
jgi:hypothetical protein